MGKVDLHGRGRLVQSALESVKIEVVRGLVGQPAKGPLEKEPGALFAVVVLIVLYNG